MSSKAQSKTSRPRAGAPVQAVVLGGSAGAVEALSRILPALPTNYGLPLLAVVHLGRGKDSHLAELFQTRCRLRVKEAEDKEPICPGTLYFAPPDYHLLVEPDRRLSLSSDEPVLYCRPAIDVLFESAADVYGPNLAGVVLTGANADGAHGLAAICRAGGLGLVEKPELAQVSAMPQAALALCPGAQSLTLEEIAAVLQTLRVESAPHDD